MLLTASQPSLSPETFGDDMKMFVKTGSTTSSGYCSSPQASDESFDGDKLDNYFGNNNSYKMWGDNGTNSEHIAHNILSQLFEEERSKSPLPNTMSSDSGIVWSNEYQCSYSETLSSPLSAFSDETADSAFMQWGGKQLAPGSQLPSQPTNGGWPASLHQNNTPNTMTAHNTAPNPLQSHFSPNFNQQYNFNNNQPGPVGNLGNMTNNTPIASHGSMSHHHSANVGGMGSVGGMGNMGGIGNHGGNGFGGFGNGPNLGGGGGRVMGGMAGMLQQNRGLPAEVLQQSLLRRKFAEQTFMNMNDNRCFPSSPNKLYPSAAPNVISLNHHKKLPLSFNSQMECPLPTQQPQIFSPDSKMLLTTIETCWSQLLQLSREQKKYEFEVSSLFKDFAKPVPVQPKHKSPFKLDLLIQNTESTHAMIIAFVDNVEKVSKSGVVMKATIKKYVAMLDEICREMLDLRRQIHPVHGLCHEETIRKLIQTLELYSKHTKVVRSNLFMMVTTLRQTKNN